MKKFCEICGAAMKDGAIGHYDKNTGNPVYLNTCSVYGCLHSGHVWRDIKLPWWKRILRWPNQQCVICKQRTTNYSFEA